MRKTKPVTGIANVLYCTIDEWMNYSGMRKDAVYAAIHRGRPKSQEVWRAHHDPRADGTGIPGGIARFLPPPRAGDSPTAGDLIYNVVVDTNRTADKSFTAGAQANITWKLLSADTLDGLAAQWGIYTGSGVIQSGNDPRCERWLGFYRGSVEVRSNRIGAV